MLCSSVFLCIIRVTAIKPANWADLLGILIPAIPAVPERSEGAPPLEYAYLSRNDEEYFENSEADDFQNVIISYFLSTDASLATFSWRSDQKFWREVANRQTDR